MKSVVIIHGCCDEQEFMDDNYPSASNSHWIPWLQKKLGQRDLLAQAPEMPRPFRPDYAESKQVLEQFDISNDTSLIGHSCGGGFLLRWLTENDKRIDKLILVAPWMPIAGDLDGINEKGFLNFEVDSTLPERVNEVHIFFSEDENTPGVGETVEYLKSHLPGSKLHLFSDQGHFTKNDMGSDKFPELLALF